MKLTYSCRGPRRLENRRPRRGCGYNLTPLVEAVPEDGQPYSVTCPLCGHQSTVSRSPASTD